VVADAAIDGTPEGGTDAALGSGGSIGSGGAATGGASSTGGTANTGGTSGSGGLVGSGGTVSTGGAELDPTSLSRYDRQILKSGFASILRLLELTAERRWLPSG
jgi:hypothetical protein